MLKGLISPHSTFRVLTPRPPFLFKKVKLSPNKLARLCENVRANDCCEIERLRLGSKHPPHRHQVLCSTGPSGECRGQEEGMMEDTSRRMRDGTRNIWKLCDTSACLHTPSLSPNYVVATFLEFLHLCINLLCVNDMSFFPKVWFSHFKFSFYLVFKIFHSLLKRVHLHPTLIMPYIFNKLSYPFITLNSFHFQSQLCHCNIRSVIAKHPSYLKWYVTNFLGIHNSSLTWVLSS